MAREEVLLDLIERIYAAAEDSRLWPAFLERLTRETRAGLAALASEDLRSRGASVTAGFSFDVPLSHDYERYYASKNVWMNAAIGRVRTGDVVTSQALLPDSELVQTEYYNDFLKPLGVRHLVGGFVSLDSRRISHISLLRERRRGEFGRTDERLIRMLLPHLHRAFQLHARLIELQSREEALREALDHVSLGIILLDQRGKPLLVNRGATTIAAQSDGLNLSSDGVSAERSEEAAELRRLISGAICTGRGQGIGASGALPISRPSFLRPYSVLVVPLTASDSVFGELRPAAAVFITDPERRVEANPQLLCRLYGLTRAEAALAELLLQGNSVEEAAERLEVTVNTARTHVKHLFEKTGTNRHRELVRLLMMSCAGLPPA